MRSFSKRPAPGQPAPKHAPSMPAKPSDDGPASDFGWHESSYELMRGLEVIECEWPDTLSGAHTLD